MKQKNVLLILAVFALLSFVFVVLYDYNNVESQRAHNQNLNQSDILPGQPLPLRPEDRIIQVPLSGVLLVVSLMLFVFYFVYSFIEQDFLKKLSILSNIATEHQSPTDSKNIQSPDATFLKLLNSHEKKIIDALIDHRGEILQSEISRMQDMGKVKAHRYLQKLANMGIVSIQRHGNTNKIILSEDIKKILLK